MWKGRGMKKETISGFMITLIVVSVLTLAFNIQQVKAIGTIHIRADGSIDPPTPLISTVDNITYTLTGNIISDSDGIVVERDNIVVDGAGYTVGGVGIGIGISSGNNVTLKNVIVASFGVGIKILGNNNTLSDNTALNNDYGIYLDEYSSYNTLSGNNASSNNDVGIHLDRSFYNNLSGNTASSNDYGIYLDEYSSYNTLSGNNASYNYYGIHLDQWSQYNNLSGNNALVNWYGIFLYGSSNNIIFHNNFIDNLNFIQAWSSDVNIWDDGYPSGGNYWSDYEDIYPLAEELDGSGIWDTPYEIVEVGQDNYPLMKPYGVPPDIAVTGVSPSKTVVGQGYSADINVTVNNQGLSTETFNVTAYYGNATITPEQWHTFWSMGDVNEDGYINMTDYDLIWDHLWTSDPQYDIDESGEVGLDDLGICGVNQGLDIWTYFLIGGLIGKQTVYNLHACYADSTTIIFTWDTTGVPYSNYTISAYAVPILSEEADKIDNNYGDGKVLVTIPGDCNGDKTVDIFDIGTISSHWYPGSPVGPLGFDGNADINDDDAVDIFDIDITSAHWGQTW